MRPASTYAIVPATLDAALEVARHARQVDRDEMWAGCRMRLEDSIGASLAASRDAGMGTVDGRPVCVWGVGVWSPLALRGMPWLVGTPELEKHARVFLRASKVYFDDMKTKFVLLDNYVDARNTTAVRWLGWLGFTIDPAQPFGPDHFLFHYYHWEAPRVS